jgi:hypothetical protein
VGPDAADVEASSSLLTNGAMMLTSFLPKMMAFCNSREIFDEFLSQKEHIKITRN